MIKRFNNEIMKVDVLILGIFFVPLMTRSESILHSFRLLGPSFGGTSRLNVLAVGFIRGLSLKLFDKSKKRVKSCLLNCLNSQISVKT